MKATTRRRLSLLDAYLIKAAHREPAHKCRTCPRFCRVSCRKCMRGMK